MRTCSLGCSRAHKERTSCSGKRAREAFVLQAEYGERNMLSDYRFVEDLTDVKDRAAKQLAGQPRAAAACAEQLPKHLRDLVRAAGQAGVTLQLMSPGVLPRYSFSPHLCVLCWCSDDLLNLILWLQVLGRKQALSVGTAHVASALCNVGHEHDARRVGMQRRKCNTTRFDRKLQKLAWRIELRFEDASYMHNLARVSQDRTFAEVRDIAHPPTHVARLPLVACRRSVLTEPARAASFCHL